MVSSKLKKYDPKQKTLSRSLSQLAISKPRDWVAITKAKNVRMTDQNHKYFKKSKFVSTCPLEGVPREFLYKEFVFLEDTYLPSELGRIAFEYVEEKPAVNMCKCNYEYAPYTCELCHSS
jgi:hypothetical protein